MPFFDQKNVIGILDGLQPLPPLFFNRGRVVSVLLAILEIVVLSFLLVIQELRPLFQVLSVRLVIVRGQARQDRVDALIQIRLFDAELLFLKVVELLHFLIGTDLAQAKLFPDFFLGQFNFSNRRLRMSVSS
jgi:hypothetical protein